MMKTRKLGTMLIAAVLLMALAFAGAVSAYPNSGTSGGIDWVLSDGNTKLTITLATNPETGYTAGQMKDFDNEAGAPPWADSCYVITSVDLPDGLQNIGDHAFYEFIRTGFIPDPAQPLVSRGESHNQAIFSTNNAHSVQNLL